MLNCTAYSFILLNEKNGSITFNFNITMKYVIKNPNFPKVVRQHISDALVDLIPSLSALRLRMRQ